MGKREREGRILFAEAPRCWLCWWPFPEVFLRLVIYVIKLPVISNLFHFPTWVRARGPPVRMRQRLRAQCCRWNEGVQGDRQRGFRKHQMLQTQSGGTMHQNYQKKRDLFVHIFKPLRTVFRHLLWVFVCGKHQMRDKRESIFKWQARQGSCLMELSICSRYTLFCL